MKKLTALFTIVAMLVCMFAIAPTAAAYDIPNSQGEIVNDTGYFSVDTNEYITMTLECHNGWLDGTFGSDYVSASMNSSRVITTCSASIDLEATYIQEGSYTSESDYEYATSLSTMSLSIYPHTDLLAYGDATFSVENSIYGDAGGSLSASCPTAVR